MTELRTKTLTLFGTLSAALLGSAYLAACSDPILFCTTQRGAFASRLEHKDGDDCLPKSYVFDLITYPGKGDALPDFAHASIAVVDNSVYPHFAAAQAAGLLENPTDVEAELRAQGKYTSASPNDKDLCQAKDFATSYELPAVEDDESTPDVDESATLTKRTYSWKNVEVEISPAVQGSIFWGELDYEADGCKATYRVKAVWPAMTCAESVEDCFCRNGEKHTSAKCASTGMSFDFVDKLACVDGLCVFKDVDRKR